MKEVIVDAEDLVCLNKEKLQELIRCKDCKRNNTNYCPMIFIEMKPNDYCSYGERKENGK